MRKESCLLNYQLNKIGLARCGRVQYCLTDDLNLNLSSATMIQMPNSLALWLWKKVYEPRHVVSNNVAFWRALGLDTPNGIQLVA